jgi:hypothetical protein
MKPGSITALILTAFTAIGAAAGVAVTRHAHRAPASPWWDQRAGRSRLRRSDLPAGGTAALLVAAILGGTGQRRAAQAATALGIGAAAGHSHRPGSRRRGRPGARPPGPARRGLPRLSIYAVPPYRGISGMEVVISDGKSTEMVS